MEPVATPAAVDALRARPGTLWIFKHSRICPESAAARAEVEEYGRAHADDFIGITVVQDHRAASDHAAKVFGVPHESPQVLLLRDGRVVWHASHGEVTQAAMEMRRLPGL